MTKGLRRAQYSTRTPACGPKNIPWSSPNSMTPTFWRRHAKLSRRITGQSRPGPPSLVRLVRNFNESRVTTGTGWTPAPLAGQDRQVSFSTPIMESPSEGQEIFSGGLAGLRVVAFESRMAQETRSLIQRHGGAAIVAPSMREVPLAENPAATEFARALLAGQLDIVIFLTGVGVKALFEVLAPNYTQEILAGALNRVITLARGPKPARALRSLGVEPKLEIAEPDTWREVLSELTRRTDLSGKRVAVQEYGVSNRNLIAGLEARGALVMLVPVYRWALPQDRGPLRDALAAIASGQAEVALFTSATQVAHVLQVAEAEGCVKEL